jgi:eukaryotic-like serine/threonine-protein kinase
MVVESLVQQLLDEIADSGRTPEEVCSGCAELLPEVRRRWAEIRAVEMELDALFPVVEDGQKAEDLSRHQTDASLPGIPGYDVEALVGHGGMGVIYKARHHRLNRVVALKMLIAGAYARPHERARFQREAEAVASLQHPNIVAVYDVGDHDGCPYFTMELLEGGSLDRKLAGTPLPSSQAATLLITLADAMQAAHQAGIVHRDLKPANILLTATGTPKVADFGLARQFERGPALTLSGVRIGTPSYMAPEQVSGIAGTIGPAADIYALGALLYEMLTGRPPFRGESVVETQRQVIHDEPVSPSRLNAKVPRDLETICLKCLSKEAERRYASAAELADDLRRFEQGRPIRARPVGSGQRSWRWCRRNPIPAALATALLALVALAVGGGLWIERQGAERQGRAREAVEAALAQVGDLRREGHWLEATAVLTQATSRLDEAGSNDLRQRLTQAEADLELAAGLERIRLTPAIDGTRFDYRAMAEAYAQAFERVGLDVGSNKEAVAARIRDSDLRPHLVMALDHWAYVADALDDRRSMARLLDLARRADPEPKWGNRFREPALWGDRDRLRRLASEVQQQLVGEAFKNGPSAPLVTLLAKKLGQQDKQAEPLLRAAQWQHPEDFWLNFALGEALREREPAEAVGFYRAALAMRPTVAAVYTEVGMAQFRQGLLDEAILAHRKAIDLEPNVAARHHNLGLCLQAKGQPDAAMAEFRRAVQLDPEQSAPHLGLGLCWKARGQLDEAMAECCRAIELDPGSAMAHHQLGRCWQDKGQLDEAMVEFRRAIKLDSKLSISHQTLGRCLHARGQLDLAMAEFRRAIELDPKLGVSHQSLGLCLQARGQLDEAIAEFHRHVQLDPKTASGHQCLAESLLQSGRFAEARAAVCRALDLLPSQEPLLPTLREKLKLCERMLALDARLPALLQRIDPAAVDEQLELARLCRDHGQPHAAARLYATAFAARPALAEDVNTGNRYHAACAAVRAAAGQGPECARPGIRERAGLHKRAIAWLRADLDLRIRLVKDGNEPGWSLADWRADPALASVRDSAALAKLPDAESEQWQRLWADVAAVLSADPLEQGRVLAARGQWDRAERCYAPFLERGSPDDGHFWFEYAALLLLSGDRPGYIQTCAKFTERCGKSPDLRPYHVARACTLAADTVTDWALPGRLAAKELKDSTREFWSLTEQGALAYRAGRFQESVPLFERSLRANTKLGTAVVNWLWLAIANQRLGRFEEARGWLNKAQAWLDQCGDTMPARADAELGLHLHNWLEAHVLRREAETLIRSGAPRSATENANLVEAQK